MNLKIYPCTKRVTKIMERLYTRRYSLGYVSLRLLETIVMGIVTTRSKLNFYNDLKNISDRELNHLRMNHRRHLRK